MALSRQTRITLLLILDTIFFFIEIVIGYVINSLAIIADSFHMLNDILSLIVAFYALKLASKTTFSSQYSYGWQRAEILGALINGVFLMALCFTIFLEAIGRFIDPPEIKRPEIMIGVGCAGLVSNIIGLLLFHEHGHGHDHDHSHGKQSTPVNDSTTAIDEILVHPAASRQSIVFAAQETISEEEESELEIEEEIATEQSPDNVHNEHVNEEFPQSNAVDADKQKKDDDHNHHNHKSQSLNMRGVFIHVLGDALGNVGVIVSGIFIYLTDYSWKYYADPVVSLILTIIIFSSALPLVKSASYILLQKVPSGIPIDSVRLEIKELPGILSVHELHIWQLSDTKRICSVHILLSQSANYMELAAKIRKILHSHGVHSITIQPEYVKIGKNKNDSGEVITVIENSKKKGGLELVANDVDNHESACLLRCSLDESCSQKLCCPPSKDLRDPKDPKGAETGQ